jgi:hypothetical protein
VRQRHHFAPATTLTLSSADRLVAFAKFVSDMVLAYRLLRPTPRAGERPVGFGGATPG